MKIRFDHGASGHAEWFDAPCELVTANTPQEVGPAFEALDAALQDGRWVAGYASYELGYALEDRLAPLMPQNRRMPLLCFGLYQGPKPAEPIAAKGAIRNLVPRWDRARYAEAFDQVHALIAAGDIYQANLTFPIDAEASGDPVGIYGALARRQPVAHGALVLQEDGVSLLSRSPEMFFCTDAQGGIKTRPMKGTQPRSADAVEDAALRDFLQQDPKNRAENLMIVDLLRNDLSRVCRPGTVKVPELFQVETYETVHQMTSLIRARLNSDTRLSQIFRALFPCGSITGAPKVRAMQVLAGLEPWPRDAYCGTIGWAAPDGRSAFNVAIRTVQLNGAQAVLNVGGGVVWDSTAASEYEEALWKARFAQGPAQISA